MAESKKKTKFSLSGIIGGGILTEEFVIRQYKLLVLIVGLIVVFITNGYQCMNKLTEIEALKGQLKDVQYENLILATEFTSHSRQSQIEELLKQKGIALSDSIGPAMKIQK
jgi:cell division protein FtsL